MGLFRDKEDIKTIKDLEEHIEYLRTIIELKDFQIHNLRTDGNCKGNAHSQIGFSVKCQPVPAIHIT